ncbi:type II toxin-antitoxin system RelE/ParE family toxin [Acinetobacter baumannii]|uniref:type II toxin-antitoxin system RelE/ParE family toxin n=1 Tax=Acinetobacter baumannii TaxID=470 RepID=UPI000FB1F296|nr:type II toxin-antitoxin system RelE/ParE family toxin [Acinetobacter baumannii]RUT37139.1 type II toxin-antitoxin system RelE/ParE family toxin [Acinetobacter baumannii]
MTYEVSYLPQAEQDLIEILAYGIETWGEKLAEGMYLKITEQLETLYFSPNRTKKKGCLGTREMLISDSPYRAIIQIDEEAKRVFILRILHTSRNI